MKYIMLAVLVALVLFSFSDMSAQGAIRVRYTTTAWKHIAPTGGDSTGGYFPLAYPASGPFNAGLIPLKGRVPDSIRICTAYTDSTYFKAYFKTSIGTGLVNYSRDSVFVVNNATTGAVTTGMGGALISPSLWVGKDLVTVAINCAAPQGSLSTRKCVVYLDFYYH